MNLLARLVRPVYFIEKKSSKKQLQDDFGEFPPAPLRCENVTGEFDVIRVRGIGELYQKFLEHRTMLRASVSDLQSLSSECVTAFDVNEILIIQREISKLGRGSKIAERLFVFLELGRMLVRTALRHGRNGRMRRSLGYFLPLLKNTSHVVIKSGRRVHESDASIVSHEHLHLLQFRNPERHRRNARSPEKFLCEKMVADPYLLYFLEKMEVEARLHEVVLSFYRAHRRLPLTVPGFLGLLAASEQCGELVALTLKHSGVTFEHYGIYSERDSMYVKQLESIWLFIETNEIQCKFMTEVLPVMYGNLLRYYGDDTASRNYMKEIERPNFYDDLYGEDSA